MQIQSGRTVPLNGLIWQTIWNTFLSSLIRCLRLACLACLSLANFFFITWYAPYLHLKGQCHESFCFRFFPWITFPQAPENNIRAFQFFRKFAEIFASQGAPPVSTTPVANLPPVSMTSVAKLPPVSNATGGKFATGYQRQILPPVPLVLLTPVANNGNNIRLQKP